MSKETPDIVSAARKCRGLDAVITASTTSTNEFADYPSWMRFTLTDALIDELLKLRALCQANDLSDVSTQRSCDVGSMTILGGASEPCRTDLDRLRVYNGDYFAFEANIRNTDVQFETVPMFFSDFFGEVVDGRRFIAQEGRDDEADAEFQEDVAEDEADMASADDEAAA
ncbi:MAG: hypothetical protein EPN36_03385 [Rhodanobacteraceae bacterium]|nr:MAG: hypothetical protein EPN36_03385 [Rhodanobacteraceae bacterium]